MIILIFDDLTARTYTV